MKKDLRNIETIIRHVLPALAWAKMQRLRKISAFYQDKPSLNALFVDKIFRPASNLIFN
jgi:hypothetical protein